MTARTTYPYLDDCIEKWAEWEGDKKTAIRVAEEYLEAEREDDGRGRCWIYEPQEVSERFRLTEDEMLMAGAAILDGRGDWYSIWCACTGEEVES